LFRVVTGPSQILNLLTVAGPLPPVVAQLQIGPMLVVKHKCAERTKGQQWRVRTLIQVPVSRDIPEDLIPPTVPIEAFVVDEAVLQHLRMFWASMNSTGVSEIHLEPACAAVLLLTRNGYDRRC
jgi:hypothetical protein